MTRTLRRTALIVVASTVTVTACMGDGAASPSVQQAVIDSTAAPTTTVPTTTETPAGRKSGPARFSSSGSSRLRFFAECPDLLGVHAR